MPGIIDTSQPEFFRAILANNYNWIEKKLSIGHFIVNDYIIYRFTKHDFQNTVRYHKHATVYQKLLDTMLMPLIIVEGNPYELFYKKQRNKFQLAYSDNAYLHYLQSLITGTRDYQIRFIPSVNQRMTLDILRTLDIEYPLTTGFTTTQVETIEGVSKRRFANFITYLSAHFATPFEQLTVEQIINGLENITIPSIGIKTKEVLLSYYKSQHHRLRSNVI